MAAPKIKSFEITFATRLLYYLGADTNNITLIKAIIAWVRKESGTNYIYNNPLNIRNSRYAFGYRQTAGNGHFAKFANLNVAAKATAAFLRANTWAGYGAVIKALKRRVTTPEEQMEQVADFFIALGLSKWSSDHYGYGRRLRKLSDPPTQDELYKYNAIIPIFNSIANQKITIPVNAALPPPKPPPVPHQPRPLVNIIPDRPYVQPYEAYNWYESRWTPAGTLPDVPMDDGW